jgi:hypothetical protein
MSRAAVDTEKLRVALRRMNRNPSTSSVRLR